jgi:serine phosphatase RsbU (regulator of sigma subunit)
MFPDSTELQESVLQPNSGDLVIAYSDGVIEAKTGEE